MSWQSFFYTGIALVLLGLVIIFVATLLLFFASVKSRAEIKGGGAVIIGPFPYSLWTVILAVVLPLLGIVMFIIGRKRTP